MKTNEFKAWFNGFTEGIEGVPTEKQWKRIKQMVKEIDAIEINYPIFVDRYWPGYQSITWGVGGAGTLNSQGLPFDSTKAMYQLGQNEALNYEDPQ